MSLNAPFNTHHHNPANRILFAIRVPEGYTLFMSMPILMTKLYSPPTRPKTVKRERLIAILNQGLHRKLTLVAAPAGFGKTSLISQWIADCQCPVAWVSLDEEDNDPARFLAYIVAALQTIQADVGEGLGNILQAPQLPPINHLLTTLLNDIAQIPDDFVLVLDDYHVLSNPVIDEAMAFLIDYLPRQMHLMITTREDPLIPLSRLRAQGQLTELRAVDLRFTLEESIAFLNTVMGLSLATEDIIALEKRTEGWIAGLQLAALSMQGQTDNHQFITAFAGDNRYIVDYLVDEVLLHQPESIRQFLLQTSILERLCGALCNHVTNQTDSSSLLESLERGNLFVIPLDNKRIWFRYHHLFGDVLRAHLKMEYPEQIEVLHQRASRWYEDNGFEIEAFQHAAAGHDIERAEKLIHSADVPMYFRGAAHPVLTWLASLSPSTMDKRPALWVMYGWTLMIAHRNAEVEAQLQSAETALNHLTPDAETRDLTGSIAALRAMLAANHYDTETIINQSQRALDLLHTQNLYVRAVVLRSLAIAYQFRGERRAARETYQQAIKMSEASGNLFVNILSTTGLGIIQLSDNELFHAEHSYQRVIEMVGDTHQPITCSAFLGLARIHYQWNQLDKAHEYAEHGIYLSKQIDVIDSYISGEILLGAIKLAQGDMNGAETLLADTEQKIYQHNFVRQIPPLIALKVHIHLQRRQTAEAKHLLSDHDLPMSLARVHLAEGDASDALSMLAGYRQQVERDYLHDKRLQVLILQALAYYQNDNLTDAFETINDVCAIAEPAGFIRIFLDEGDSMLQLLQDARAQGVVTGYVDTVIHAFDTHDANKHTPSPIEQPLIEALSEREIEILRLIADGLSNQDICDHLYLALSTVKGHNRNIYGKLGVNRRTEAVARARELGLLG